MQGSWVRIPTGAFMFKMKYKIGEKVYLLKPRHIPLKKEFVHLIDYYRHFDVKEWTAIQDIRDVSEYVSPENRPFYEYLVHTKHCGDKWLSEQCFNKPIKTIPKEILKRLETK